MNKKHKCLIIFSIVAMVLLILIELGFLCFVLKSNDYAVDIPIDVPTDIVIEQIESNTFKILNQTFKRVSLPDEDNSSLLGYDLKEFETDLNSENSNLFMIDKQIYIKDNGYFYLLFFIDSGYFYVNIDIFDNTLISPSQDDLGKVMIDFIDILTMSDTVDYKVLNKFMNDLQLVSRGVATAMLSHVYYAKPVIYLYPKEEIDIEVNLYGATFTTTYPEYNNGWFVTAYPDGTLVDKNGREYNYLYWEGMSKTFIDVSKGFVIEKENYIEFLETTFSEIGMIDTEINDFITYWLPQMNEHDYCFLSFQMENYEKEIQLKYSIEPDNELRVYVVFCGLDKYMDVQSQDLSYYSNFMREGFTVVEWGGTFLKNSDAVLYQTNNMGRYDNDLKKDTNIKDINESLNVDKNKIINSKNEFNNNMEVKNQSWCVYFEGDIVNTTEDFIEGLEKLNIVLDKKLKDKFFLDGHKIYLGEKLDKDFSLLMIIEEYGIYFDLDVFNTLISKHQTDFLKVFIDDWLLEVGFNDIIVESFITDLQSLDKSVATAILPIIVPKKSCCTMYTPFEDENFLFSIMIVFVMFGIIFFIIDIGHKIVSKSIVVNEEIKNYFLPYLIKESKWVQKIGKKVWLLFVLIMLSFVFGNIQIFGIPIFSVLFYSIPIVIFTIKSLSVTFLNDICREIKIGKKNCFSIFIFYFIFIFMPLLFTFFLLCVT